ncbi:MAG: hypothetical protein H7836_14720 [Magnetococcus sp. YQC-3]
MINRGDLQTRRVPITLDGGQFLTSRTARVVSGAVETIYMGFAHPGSQEGVAVWMIRRITIAADGSTTTLFAGGQALFNQVWADRASLSYS